MHSLSALDVEWTKATSKKQSKYLATAYNNPNTAALILTFDKRLNTIMIKFNSVMFFASSMFAGFLFTTDSMASLDNATSATPAKTATVPVQPEMLIEKANVAPSDASITMAVLKILRQADALNIAVVARKGQVTLIGFVPTSEDRNRIITRVEKVEGVRKVKAEAFAATTLNPGFER